MKPIVDKIFCFILILNSRLCAAKKSVCMLCFVFHSQHPNYYYFYKKRESVFLKNMYRKGGPEGLNFDLEVGYIADI
jgi:hypothetical protein